MFLGVVLLLRFALSVDKDRGRDIGDKMGGTTLD